MKNIFGIKTIKKMFAKILNNPYNTPPSMKTINYCLTKRYNFLSEMFVNILNNMYINSP